MTSSVNYVLKHNYMPLLQNKEGRQSKLAAFEINPATCYSPKAYTIVPSPLRGLTAVFGMGTGVSPSL